MDRMLKRLIGEDIDLVTVLDAQLGCVKVDPGQIEQVVLNLAINARDAMPGGGRLTIETCNVELDDAYARRHTDVLPGPYVLIAVSDTGCGMDEDTKSRIFEPFFTTKDVGKGTGLGLSTIYGIVRQSGGHIWVYSEVGRGTTFKIYFPRVEGPPEEFETLGQRAALARGTETVLLVEDEAEVRKLVREILEMNGYKVLEVDRGSKAIEIGERCEEPIHLMITDVVMPGMSGRELAQRLAPVRPQMRVLYMSGYTENAIVHHGVLDEETAFIQKPFTPAALALKVRQVLDKTPQTDKG
jgi:CheY-like chemotaxis protein